MKNKEITTAEEKELITAEEKDAFSDLYDDFATLRYALERIDEKDEIEMFLDIASTYSAKMQESLGFLAKKLS